MTRFTITDSEGDPNKVEHPSDYARRRAALVSVGALYEDYDGPLSPEMVESADRIIAERQRR